MARLNPVSRTEFIRRLKELGFTGPYSGGRHQFMLHQTRRLILPNPHRGDISPDLLSRLLRQAGVSREEWETPRPRS